MVNALKTLYPITIDWTDLKYLGVTLDWDYVKQRVNISMPRYIKDALLKFIHHRLEKQTHDPHKWTPPPSYSAKI